MRKSDIVYFGSFALVYFCTFALFCFGLNTTDEPSTQPVAAPTATTCACTRCADLEKRVAALEKREAERERRHAEMREKAQRARAVDQVREKVRRHAVKPPKGENLKGEKVTK